MEDLISVVIPVYNEAVGVQNFFDNELIPVLEKLKEKIEIIIIDDGSTDESLEIIRNYKFPRQITIKIVALMKNFGKEIALTAGLREAKGDAIIMIDADGQHPAGIIPKMVEKWRKGAKVVVALRGLNTTKHKLGSRFYYALMRRFGDKNTIEGEMDFRLLDHEVADAFNQFTEHNRLTRSLINWLGYPREYIEVHTKNRIYGRPTYNMKKLATLAGDSIVSASRIPLIIFGYIGLFIMVITFIPGLFQLIQEYFLGDPLHLEWGGAVALSLFVAFLVGLVLVSQTMTALYISQIHAEVKGRPLYIINKAKSVGLKNDKK